MRKILSIILITILINKKNALNCSNIQNLKNKYLCQIEKFPDSFFQKAFNFFKEIFSKKYFSESEEKKRYKIFKENYKKILVHNLTNSSFKQEVNNFTDLTENEFERKFLSNFAEETSDEENLENDDLYENDNYDEIIEEKNVDNFYDDKENENIKEKKEIFENDKKLEKNEKLEKMEEKKKLVERDYYYRYNGKTRKIERVYFE